MLLFKIRANKVSSAKWQRAKTRTAWPPWQLHGNFFCWMLTRLKNAFLLVFSVSFSRTLFFFISFYLAFSCQENAIFLFVSSSYTNFVSLAVLLTESCFSFLPRGCFMIFYFLLQRFLFFHFSFLFYENVFLIFSFLLQWCVFNFQIPATRMFFQIQFLDTRIFFQFLFPATMMCF